MNNEVDYQLETIAGAPGDVFTSQTKSKEFDFVVMGSHGHSNTVGLCLGSVTHKGVNKIYCLILIVP